MFRVVARSSARGSKAARGKAARGCQAARGCKSCCPPFLSAFASQSWWAVAARGVLCCAVVVGGRSSLNAESLWQQLVPQKRVSSDPRADYTLTEENGPWLVMATTFSGDDAESQAKELVLELRERFSLPSFVHQMSFDLSGPAPGRGIDRYGSRLRTRYAKDGRLIEYAVLVGEFVNVNDPGLQQLLKRVKGLQPDSLVDRDIRDSAQSFAMVREVQNRVRDRNGGLQRRGPLARAFVTRNPLLPREYFVPKGVDDFVAKLNEGLEYSLLDCPAKYTVKVATFRGRSALESTASANRIAASVADDSHPLAQAADKAHRLTVALRLLGAEEGAGWEAYEFHDRFESYVTVGAFDRVIQQLPDGRVIPTRDVQVILQTFGNASSSGPFRGDANLSARDVDYSLREFKRRLGGTGKGQLAQHANANFKHLLAIPFDVHPTVIEVPRHSISSSYAQKAQ